MTARADRWELHLSSGRGPWEVRNFLGALVAPVVAGIRAEGIEVGVLEREGRAGDPLSVRLHLSGPPSARWLGTHVLLARSAQRGRAARKRWFVGVTLHPPRPGATAADPGDQPLDPATLQIRSCRSGGPGGQHANTAATAVQLTHRPTEITVRAEGQRSQSANLRAARAALRSRLAERSLANRRQEQRRRWRDHDRVERGGGSMRWRWSRGGELEPAP